MVLMAALGPLPRGILIAAFTAIVGSLLAWFVGSRVSYRWDERKRRREGDLAARLALYRNYGEFFATWKVWDAVKRHADTASPPPDARWRLLERASSTEGEFELLLVKIAAERDLTPADRVLLACFREGYQSLRESIRTDRALQWWASGASLGARQYRAFKALAAYVALLLERDARHTRGSRTLSFESAAGPSRAQSRTDDDRSHGDGRQRQAHAIANLLAVSSREDFHQNWVDIAEQKLDVERLAAGFSKEMSRELSPIEELGNRD